MRRRMKKAVAVLASAAFVFSMMPAVTGFAAEEKATVFTFADTGITVDAGDFTDYEIDGTDLKITGEGEYVVKGECGDGSITVKKNVSGVTLTLSDLTLSSKSTAPLSVNKYAAANIVIDGEVTLSDTINNSEDYLEDKLGMTEDEIDSAGAENAVIKLKDASQVIISGSGTLNVNAFAKNGIKAGSSLDENGEETAPGSSGNDGWLQIEGITLNINATKVYDPGDGDTYGDGINGEAYVWLKSGTYNVAAGDDAVHSDYYLNIGDSNGGEDPAILVSACTEGLEGAIVNIFSGDIDIFADEDAINAANSDLSDYQFGIVVTGGDIYAVAGGDGDAFDSNGTILISGGWIEAFGGPMGNAFDTGTDGNNSIDSTFAITGGTVLGLGSAQMAVSPAEGSQGYAVWTGAGSGFGPGGNPFDGGDGERPTPPNGGNGERPTPPNGGNGERPTPPEGWNGEMPTLPDGGNGEMPTLPDGGNGEMPTLPDGGNGGFPGGNFGSATGTVTNLTFKVNGTSYASGDQVTINAGNTVAVMDGDESLMESVAMNAASYVIFSAPGLEISEDPVEPVDPVNPVEPVDPVEPVEPVDPDDPDDPGEPEQPTFGRIGRFYNPNSGEHFYTRNRSEGES